jgi:thiosulfate/3-mercaptopyruvate sulfurtransferase
MRSLVMLCCCACLLSGAAVANEPAAGILVSPSWLAEHLQDPSVVVLQIANLRADYDRGHIPGARFLWPTWLAENTPEQTLAMPPLKTLRRVLEQLGVSNDSRVVICHTLGDVSGAARMYVTLDYLGMGDRTFILDGGLEAWQTDGPRRAHAKRQWAPRAMIRARQLNAGRGPSALCRTLNGLRS